MHRVHYVNDIRLNRFEIVNEVIFHFLVVIVLEMKETIAFAERDAMDRKSLVHGVAGANALECIVSLRWFVTNDRDFVATLHRLASQASRVDFRSGAPVGKECVNDESNAQAISLTD